MTDLERISKVVDDLFDIMDTARSNFGEEGYNALDKARQAVTDAWNVCKRGQERRGINNSHKPIKSTFGGNAVFEIMDNKLMDARRNIRSCISINPKRELDNELQNIDELIGDALTHTEMVKNGDYDNYMSPVNNSRKPIKSFRDTSNEDNSNDYGFHWDGENIYDKDGNHWYYGDYINGNTGIEPYSSYIQAVKETADEIRNSFTEDEISDPEDYAYQLVDFAVETMEDPGKYIKEYEGF